MNQTSTSWPLTEARGNAAPQSPQDRRRIVRDPDAQSDYRAASGQAYPTKEEPAVNFSYTRHRDAPRRTTRPIKPPSPAPGRLVITYDGVSDSLYVRWSKQPDHRYDAPTWKMARTHIELEVDRYNDVHAMCLDWAAVNIPGFEHAVNGFECEVNLAAAARFANAESDPAQLSLALELTEIAA